MRRLRTLYTIGLIGLFALHGVIANGQTNAPTDNIKNEMLGIWGMHKDKHPDGWGSFNPPYMYLEFKENNKYERIYLNNKGNSILFGTYELTNDSLIIFHESIITDGIHEGLFKADTVRLYSLKSDLMELWEDWDRILWKSTKKWGHKQKYRPLTKEEMDNLEFAKTRLMFDYDLLKNPEKKKKYVEIKLDTVMVIGKISKLNDYMLNPTDTLNSKRGAELNEMLKIYELKKDVILKSIDAIPLGYKKSDEIIKNDKYLKNFDQTHIWVSYEFGQYQDFDILFKPSLEIEDEFWSTILVSCTPDQLKQLRDINKETTKYIFTLRYLGEFNPPRRVCRLVSWKIFEDK